MRSYYVLIEAIEDLTEPTMTEAHEEVLSYDRMLRASRSAFKFYCQTVMPDDLRRRNLARTHLEIMKERNAEGPITIGRRPSFAEKLTDRLNSKR